MGKLKKVFDNLDEKLSISRRSFVKGAVAVGAGASLYGCSKDGGDGEIIYGGGGSLDNVVTPEDLSNPSIYYAGCVHNCGAGVRCVSKLHVVNGRVVRVTSDDSEYDFEGNLRDKNQFNDSRSLTCAKGRAFKYRIYHPGRLKYALKQTKQRGDMSGFIRITPHQAMLEIAQKYRAIYTKYGPGAIYNTYGTSSSYGGTFSNASGARGALTSFVGGTRGGYSDYSYHQYNFSYMLTGHPNAGTPYSTNNNIGSQFPAIAGVVKNIVSWGTNALSTNNTVAYPYIRVVEMMKARRPESKVYFIGPEFVDTGVTLATDWVQLRNYTDTALIMAMFHEMLVNTFNADGSIKNNPWLDVNYLDTMVYGFFDSPEYWVKTADGTIATTLPADTTGYRRIDAVPAGRSLSAYVMGSDARLTASSYVDAANYTAQQFSGKQAKRNGGTCSYPVSLGGSTKYLYKKDFNTPKTPEWAEKICGTPAATIRNLAKMYCDPAQHPIFNEWCGGVQKQENGVINIFAISALLCVTKTFGMNGEGLYGPWASTITSAGDRGDNTDYLSATGSTPADIPKNATGTPPVPSISCKEWFNGIKVGFHDVLKAKGYTGKHVPDWDGQTRYLNDDAGAKTGVLWKRNSDNSIATYTDPEDGLTYFDYEGRDSGTPTFVGTRMIISSGGGIQLNQHSNTNDTAEMYKNLPLSALDPSDPDSFCLVQFDPYMSPTARFADYVLPATMSLEAGDWMSIGGETIYRPPVSKAPGDTLDGWTWAYEAYKAQSELGTFNGVNTAEAHFKYVGTFASGAKKFQSAEVLSMEIVDKARGAITGTPINRFNGMTRAEVFASEYRPRKNQTPDIITTEFFTTAAGKIRQNLDEYLALDDVTRKATPFIFVTTNGTQNKFDAGTAGWGTGANIAESEADKPVFAGRLQVYNNTVVWEYIRRFSKYHGWLPKEKRGQPNKDYENDMKVYPIPMYINFEDCFNEAYGVFSGKPDNDLSKKGGLTMSTTHDRYRVHSTMAENPLLRELNHRTKGGKWASGNDWKEFCVMPERHIEGAAAPISPMISSAVYKKDMTTASWHEIWVNTQDAVDRGIADGDLIRVENPIGAVRVIARVTDRCMRGHINLHQGGWYDPNPIDGVDDGGCANTLMACKASRYDHGNAQQFAYVTIKKETSF